VHQCHVHQCHVHQCLCSLPDLKSPPPPQVKFWTWAVVVTPEGAKQLSIQHMRTLKMADDVLCVKVSPDGKMLAVALLDATIKVRAGLAHCVCCAYGCGPPAFTTIVALQLATTLSCSNGHAYDRHTTSLARNCITSPRLLTALPPPPRPPGLLHRLAKVLPQPVRPQAAGAVHGHQQRRHAAGVRLSRQEHQGEQ
jgi:hypothetical protein